MAVTGRDLRSARRPHVSLHVGQLGSAIYLVTGGFALFAVYILLSSLVSWGQVLIDDVRYGRPRTFHLSATVGRSAEINGPTHLIAMNLDRQVMILEIPGGDTTQTRAIPGPYLFGEGEDLTPVTMRLLDVNADGNADLIVQVKNEEMIYINRDQAFNLITPEERQAILSQRAGE